MLDLVSIGHAVFVCADAVSSRRTPDRQAALSRIRHAGATVTTTEAVLFELCGDSASAHFKQLLELIKSFDQAAG